MSRNFLTPIVLPAGTASNAPLSLQSGSNLASATAGAVEYDGKVIYSTPAARGVSPSMMFYRLDSNLAGASATTAQSVFGAGITLNAGTVYAFNGSYIFTKSTGATSHSFSILFGGTATLNNILYQGIFNSQGSGLFYGTITGAKSFLLNFATVQSLITGIASTGYTVQIQFAGTVSINAGGTFIPQYQLSAAPGGVYSTVAGSYLAIWPIGASGANTSVGPWA